MNNYQTLRVELGKMMNFNQRPVDVHPKAG
jgi:hypothetical protein